jgi:hypothetical protein
MEQVMLSSKESRKEVSSIPLSTSRLEEKIVSLSVARAVLLFTDIGKCCSLSSKTTVQ